MVAQFVHRGEGSSDGQPIARGIEAESVVTERHRLGSVHARLADDAPDAESQTVLQGLAGDGDDFDAPPPPGVGVAASPSPGRRYRR